MSRGGGGTEDGVEAVAGDATDAGRMREVCAGSVAVYNAVNPPFDRWREAFPAAVRGTLAGATAAGARLVFADDTWMYGRVDAPMTEATPVRPVSAKGVLRAWLAEIGPGGARPRCRPSTTSGDTFPFLGKDARVRHLRYASVSSRVGS